MIAIKPTTGFFLKLTRDEMHAWLGNLPDDYLFVEATPELIEWHSKVVAKAAVSTEGAMSRAEALASMQGVRDAQPQRMYTDEQAAEIMRKNSERAATTIDLVGSFDTRTFSEVPYDL